MVRAGEKYMAVVSVGLVEILLVDEPRNSVSVKITQSDKVFTDKWDLMKTGWMVDRGDLVYEKSGKDIDAWMLDKVKVVLKNCFGLSTILASYDPIRVRDGVKVICEKTGFSPKFVYSILPTIKQLN